MPPLGAGRPGTLRPAHLRAGAARGPGGRSLKKGRLEAFSDGIFAIAITLLVLTIPQPQHYDRLASSLGELFPSFAAYVVSFAVIGVMWLNHHTILNHLEHIDRPVIYLNHLLLLTVAFLPYPTQVLGEALRRRESPETAALFYSTTMALNAYTWTALWLYASGGRRHLNEGFPEERRRQATVGFTIGTAFYTLTLPVAAVSAVACLVFHALLVVYYALDPLTRFLQRGAVPAPDP